MPGLFRVGNSLRLAVTRRAAVPALVAHSPPRPAGTGTRLSLTRLPPRLGTSPPQRDSRYLGKLGLSSCLPGAALFIPSPLRSPRGLPACLCPQDSRLSGTSKLRAPQGAGREGGMEDAEDGSGGSWTQIPAGRDEGLTRLLLIELNADSALLSQLRPKLQRDTNCSWDALPVLQERMRGILLSESSLTTTLSKPETKWERVSSERQPKRDGEAFLVCSPSLSGEEAKIIRKIHYFSTVCNF